MQQSARLGNRNASKSENENYLNGKFLHISPLKGINNNDNADNNNENTTMVDIKNTLNEENREELSSIMKIGL